MLTTFDAWYVGQSEPMQIAIIGAVVALWGSITAGVIAVLVAWVQARMAKRAVEAQERSTFLGLIDRRARWFDEAMQLWTDWISDQERVVEAIVVGDKLTPPESANRMAASRREAKWLFGSEVTEHLEAMADAVRDYSQKRRRMRELAVLNPKDRPAAEFDDRSNEFSASLTAMMALQGRLAAKVSPYLHVGDIRAFRQ